MLKEILVARAILEKYGYVVGDRNPRLNTDFAGRFMVCEPYDESELPTKDGRNGPWCIVGDDLESLILDASTHAPCFDSEAEAPDATQ